MRSRTETRPASSKVQRRLTALGYSGAEAENVEGITPSADNRDDC